MTSPSIDQDNFEPPESEVGFDLDLGSLSFGDEQELLSLIDIGKQAETISLPGGHSALIRTTTHAEEIAIFYVISKYKESEAYPSAYRLARVAACLEEVDGEPLLTELKKTGTMSAAERITKKIAILGDFHQYVIDNIYTQIGTLESSNMEALSQLGK